MEIKLESPLSNLEELSLGHVCLETGEVIVPREQDIRFILSPVGTVGGKLSFTPVVSNELLLEDAIDDDKITVHGLGQDIFVEIEIGENAGFTQIDTSIYTLPNVTTETICTLRFTEKVKKVVLSFYQSTQLTEVLEWDKATILQGVSFSECSNLHKVPTDIPTSIRSLRGVFRSLGSTVMDWSRVLLWDVSRVIDFYSAFMDNDVDFGAPFRWDFRNAENLSYMFQATTLYQDLYFDHVLVTKQVNISNIFHLAQGTDDLYIGLGSLDRYTNTAYAFSKMACSGRGIESAGYQDGDDLISLTDATYMFEQCKLKNASKIIPTLNWSKVRTAKSLFANAEFIGDDAPTKLIFPDMPRVTTIDSACLNLAVSVELHYDMPMVTGVSSAFSHVQSVEIAEVVELPKVVTLTSTFAGIKQGISGLDKLSMPALAIASNMFANSEISSLSITLAKLSEGYAMFSGTAWKVASFDLRGVGDASLNMQGWFLNTIDESIADLEILFPQDKTITNVSSLFSGSAWKGKGNIETLDVSGVNSHSAIAGSFNNSQATCDLSGWCVERVAESTFTPSTEWDNTKLTGLPKWGEPCPM